MGCYSPLTAYWSTRFGESGKRLVTFNRNEAFSGVPLKLPCGQCIGCRLERSRQWAMRCMHEKQFHKSSWFVTLTYNEESLPLDGSLNHRTFQLFCKRLRKACGPFRFYMCGEYGELNRRPHYHAILYGIDFDDRRFYKYADKGRTQMLQTSEKLSAIWGLGFVVLAEVNFETCAYVARYVVDKVTGDAAKEFYSWVDQDGQLHEVAPEYNKSSNRPGIGQAYFNKYGAEVYSHDSVVMNGREVRPPRFYDKKMEAIDPKRMEALKLKRHAKALRMPFIERSTARLRVRQEVARRNLNEKKRSKA